MRSRSRTVMNHLGRRASWSPLHRYEHWLRTKDAAKEPPPEEYPRAERSVASREWLQEKVTQVKGRLNKKFSQYNPDSEEMQRTERRA
eukprot:1465522-Karenia_brevis.AAC.1